MIRHDRHYLSDFDNLAIEKGFAALDVHCFRLDHIPYTEEQMMANTNLSHTLSRDEWGAHCDNLRSKNAEKVRRVVDQMGKRFTIYQYKDDSIVNYRSDWDLFFWCNCEGGMRDYSYVTLSLNDQRTVEQREDDVSKVVGFLNTCEGADEICATIQYKCTYDKNKLKVFVDSFAPSVIDIPIDYRGMKGKIYKFESGTYAFFKRNAKKTYYTVSDVDFLRMALA